MRARGACQGLDGCPGSGGGGGAVDSVNGKTGVVVLDASDIPSTGPSTVQADLAVLDGSTLTNVAAFQSWPEFAALCIEAPAGVFTFDGVAAGAGLMLMPVGARVVLGENHAISGGTTSASLTWIANVDAPAFTGPLSMARMTVVQTNPGVDARCLDLATTAGRGAFVTEVQVVGGRVGVRVVDVDDAAKLDTVHAADNDIGFQLANGTYGSVVLADCSAVSSAPGFVAFTVDSGATLNGGLLVTDPGLILTTGQFGFAISHAATFVGEALMQVAGASNSGPQNAMFRQTNPGVTDMSTSDVRLVVKGGPSAPDWSAVGTASRTDLGDPLLVVFGGTDTNTLIPYEDGAGNLEIVASTEQRFSFVKGVAVTDWHWQYEGPLNDVSAALVLDFLHDRSAGTGFALLRWQVDLFPAYAGFQDIDDTDAPFENTNAVSARTATAIVTGLKKFDRLRVVAQNSDDTTSLRLGEFKMDVLTR